MAAIPNNTNMNISTPHSSINEASITQVPGAPCKIRPNQDISKTLPNIDDVFDIVNEPEEKLSFETFFDLVNNVDSGKRMAIHRLNGFTYQILISTLDCVKLLETPNASIMLETFEDISVYTGSITQHIQVKLRTTGTLGCSNTSDFIKEFAKNTMVQRMMTSDDNQWMLYTTQKFNETDADILKMFEIDRKDPPNLELFQTYIDTKMKKSNEGREHLSTIQHIMKNIPSLFSRVFINLINVPKNEPYHKMIREHEWQKIYSYRIKVGLNLTNYDFFQTTLLVLSIGMIGNRFKQ